ncbi:hypothetical protein VNI00_019053 [Paramarasmius palmivorus]|uniref:DNA 3'-5' helicase n=1 Tax=Paramarasmius palmivorus TaxID=297713 RepID=A0AAW0ARY0_9AGAR
MDDANRMLLAPDPTKRHQLLAILASFQVEDLRTLATDHISNEAAVPWPYIDTLSRDQQSLALTMCLVCWFCTQKKQVPREIQLQAAVAVSSTSPEREHRDLLLIAPTGSGKTLTSILLQMTKSNHDITVLIIPLKRLQDTTRDDIFNEYGLKAVVINQDTPRNREWWDQNLHRIETKQPGTAELIIVTPEQFFRQKGEQMLTRFGELMEERQFTSRISLVVVDEGHMVSTSGIPHFGYPKAFRDAYGKLKTVQIRLGQVPWLIQTATMTCHFLSDLESVVLRKPYKTLKISTNRSNIMYATHGINKMDDFSNFRCFLVKPFSLESQPYVIIFRENKKWVENLAVYLNGQLPAEHQGKGIVQFYSSDMSERYLSLTHQAFVNPENPCRILVATSAEATGINHPRVDIVCSAGTQSTRALESQMYGRAVRRPGTRGLAVLFYEQWMDDISFSEFDDWPGDPLEKDNPDRPRRPFTSERPSEKERVTCAAIHMTSSEQCLRAQFAGYLLDDDPNALSYVTEFCCNRHRGSGFSLQDHLPGPLGSEKIDVVPTVTEGALLVRSPDQQEILQQALEKWRDDTFNKWRLRVHRPKCFILDEAEINVLVSQRIFRIRNASDVADILNRAQDWRENYGGEIAQVIHLADCGADNAQEPRPTSVGYISDSDDEL